MKELIILIILLMSPIALAKDSKIIKDCNPKSIEINVNCKKRDIQGEPPKSSCDNKHCLFVKKKIDYVK